jgi:hypothetical protein
VTPYEDLHFSGNYNLSPMEIFYDYNQTKPEPLFNNYSQTKQSQNPLTTTTKKTQHTAMQDVKQTPLNHNQTNRETQPNPKNQ